MARNREGSGRALGLACDDRRLRQAVLQYRRLARTTLIDLIADIENDVQRRMGAFLPVNRRCTERFDAKAWRWVYTPEGEYTQRLREVVDGRFYLRSWSSRRVVSRQRFWTGIMPVQQSAELEKDRRKLRAQVRASGKPWVKQKPGGGSRRRGSKSGCGMDEVLDALGYYDEAAAGEGEQDGFDSFLGILGGLKTLRGWGGLTGMLKYGLEVDVAGQIADCELDWILLGAGTIDEVAQRLAKELSLLDQPYGAYELNQRELASRRRAFRDYVRAEEPDAAFAELLTDFDQQLLGLDGIVHPGLQAVAACRLGIKPAGEVAEVIELPRPAPVRHHCAAVG